jgi:hypothetical protein
MTYPNRVSNYLGLALMFSLLTFVPEPSFAACKNSGGTVGNHKLGSQVNGSSVTICAKAVSVTPARTAVVVKPIAKPQVPKKAIFRKQAPVSLSQKVSKPVFKPASKPVAKSKPASKTKSKSKSTGGAKNVTSASANFTPAGVTGMVYPSNQLGVGQIASFVSSAVVHYRSGYLLAQPTEVRFTPVSIDWHFGEGVSGSGNALNYAFDREGTFAVKVIVSYSVSYRLKGSQAWIAEPDQIQVSDDLFVEVSELGNPDPFVEETKRRVLLVGDSCLERPGTFGCN